MVPVMPSPLVTQGGRVRPGIRHKCKKCPIYFILFLHMLVRPLGVRKARQSGLSPVLLLEGVCGLVLRVGLEKGGKGGAHSYAPYAPYLCVSGQPRKAAG